MNKFKSVFKDEFAMFIAVKRNEGLKYNKEEYKLLIIDDILYRNNIQIKKIDSNTFNLIMNSIPSESLSAKKEIYALIRQFSRYMKIIGFDTIEYEDITFIIKKNYVPVLFSDEQMLMIFDACDKKVNTSKNNRYYKLYYTYSIMLRLLYSCGLRVSEAVNLTCEDVDFNLGSIRIHNSKRNVSRMIVLSDTMKQCLMTYVNHFNIKSGVIFLNTRGKKVDSSYLLSFYRNILRSLVLNEKATLHNLRHQFTNTTYSLMLKKGFDENVIIAYLHRYLGHNTIKETEYYLHFTTDRKEKLITASSHLSKYLFKDVITNE